MIGIVLTGHGSFATGLAETARLLAGDIDRFVAVEFPPGMSAEELEARIGKALDSLPDCEHIVILTDLPGGTPFRAAAALSLSDDRLRVLSGTNVPLLLQLALSRTEDACVDELIANALAEARQAVMVFEIPKS